MGILIKAGVDDHGLRSRKSIAQTSTWDGHTATATTYNKHPVTDALQQQLRTMMSAIQGRKAFVQCAILVAVVLLALTANAAAQEEYRHGGGRHPPRRPPHHGHRDPCDCRGGCQWVWGSNICYVRDPDYCGWANQSYLRPGEKWRY